MNIPVEVNSLYKIVVVDLNHKGQGIGKIDGFTIFLNKGVPGDKGTVRITKLKKNYAIGEMVEILEESKDRVKSICDIADDCGGCQTQEIDYNVQLEMKTEKVKNDIKRIGGLESVTIHNTIGMDNPFRYRNKAQFPVRKYDEKISIGFYKTMSHEVIDSDKCFIQHDINDEVVKIVRKYMETYNVSPYDEKTGKGIVRHILTKTSFKTRELMVVIITNNKKLPNKDILIKELTDNIKSVKSIVQNINESRNNVILGNKSKTLWGEDKIVDYIKDLKFKISPESFFQVNPVQTEVLYEKALEYADLKGEETVFDIYCGIGTISLFLARKAKKVYGIEVVERAIIDANENAKLNNIENVEFFDGAAEKVFPKLYEKGIKADVVVVDPPRKGCDEKVLDTIVRMNPKRVVYVSCNPATLARDLKYLDNNGYKTVEIQPVDMFPHTMHIENVARLERKDK